MTKIIVDRYFTIIDKMIGMLISKIHLVCVKNISCNRVRFKVSELVRVSVNDFSSDTSIFGILRGLWTTSYGRLDVNDDNNTENHHNEETQYQVWLKADHNETIEKRLMLYEDEENHSKAKIKYNWGQHSYNFCFLSIIKLRLLGKDFVKIFVMNLPLFRVAARVVKSTCLLPLTAIFVYQTQLWLCTSCVHVFISCGHVETLIEVSNTNGKC